MTYQEAIKRIQDHIRIHRIGEYPHIKLGEALNMATAALREKAERENREPLTLEELRKLDNCPVYVRHGDGREGWVILVWECEAVILYGPEWDESPAGEPDLDFYDLRYDRDPQGHFGLHSLGWLAYRNSPKEAEEK